MLLSAAIFAAVPEILAAQTTPPQSGTVPTDPAIRARLLAQVKNSGMSAEEIRARLKELGYSDNVINQIVGGPVTDSTLGPELFAAIRDLGIMDSTAVDSLGRPAEGRRRARNAKDDALFASIDSAIQNDTLRAAIERLLRSPAARRVGADSGFELFGRDVFARTTAQFDPAVSGPLPPDYRIGAGDKFTVVLTGEVERTEELEVTRDGVAFLRGVGQIPAANLTFEQLRSVLENRLGAVYSGIGRGRARFAVLPTEVGTNQIFVLGDVVSPNAYQISRLGTVLTALYAAGGPSENGDARSVDVKRNGRVIATMDLYDYLLTGSASSDVRLDNGDVVFVRPRGPRVRVAGAVVRPATYELKAGETLADAIRMAGGFLPEAERRRLQIERIVPPTQREQSGSDKEVIDITSPSLATRVESGDVVHVYTVAQRVANQLDVEGLGVWHPSRIAFVPGMRLSQAIKGAGGLKPDAYLGAVQISRLQGDSTRKMTRVGLRTDGTPVDDVELMAHDVVTIYSMQEFRTQRFVTVGGAVRKASEVPYQEGMTLRDAILAAGGLEESALLTQAEIARLPENRANGVTATTFQVALDSTYLFERGPDGRYQGPPGVQVPSSRVPEVPLEPYDAVSILRQPDFEYQRTVTVAGRVKYAGTYSLKSKTERLSDIIARAGGLASDADSSAIVFFRQRDSTGRVGVNLPRVLRNPNDIDNLILVDKDSIFIPPYNAIVMVRGAVNSPAAAIAYRKGADIDYYIRSAGGGTAKADEKRAYVLQPSGKVETKHRTPLLYVSVPKPQPGAVVQVPPVDPNAPRMNWVAAAQTALSFAASLVTVYALVKTQR
jgi:protein involved in polysaccharide export with SLBB domain